VEDLPLRNILSHYEFWITGRTDYPSLISGRAIIASVHRISVMFHVITLFYEVQLNFMTMPTNFLFSYKCLAMTLKSKFAFVQLPFTRQQPKAQFLLNGENSTVICVCMDSKTGSAIQVMFAKLFSWNDAMSAIPHEISKIFWGEKLCTTQKSKTVWHSSKQCFVTYNGVPQVPYRSNFKEWTSLATNLIK